MTAVGKSLPHESARGHVTGQAYYIDDRPRQPGELFVDFFGSPCAHGHIQSLRLDEAAALAGVCALFTYKDIEGVNKFGPIFQDEVFLAETETHFLGEPIVVIAAESREAAAAARGALAAGLVIEELPPIFTVDQALAAGAFLGPQRRIARGDFANAYEAAEHKLEGKFLSGGQEQFYLESQIALALPGEARELTIHTSTQNPTEVQKVVAEVLGLGHHQVIAICKRMGGAFGGKETQGVHPALMAGIVALKTGRPARCAYTKDTDMRVTGKRHPYQSFYQVGFDREGRIGALHVDFYSNGGATADLSTSVFERSLLHADNAYYIENFEVQGRVCRTNLPPNTAFRGFGGPQGMAVIENAMEEIGIFLGIDPALVRERNLYGKTERNVTPYGQVLYRNVMPELFAQLKHSSDYAKRREEIRAFNRVSRTHRKGIAFTPVKFGISFTTKHLNQASALVNLYTDGTVQVSTGGTEMGQGLNTKIQQIVADEFAIPFAHVRVMATSTEKNNNASPTAASAGTDLNGSAAVEACRKIRERLGDHAARLFANPELGLIPSAGDIVFSGGRVFDRRIPEKSMTFVELVVSAYRDRVSLGERGFYATPGVDFNRETGRGNPFFYYTNCACVAEITLDRFTGEVRVDRLDALLDFGQSINPGIDRGQATGGIIQGMGWVTNEELRYGPKGELLSHSPTTYKIPNIQDTPPVFNVNLFDNREHELNVRSSKAVAEPPLMLGLAVFGAIKMALASFAGGAIPPLNLPATSEEVLKRIETWTADDAGANGNGRTAHRDEEKELALID